MEASHRAMAAARNTDGNRGYIDNAFNSLPELSPDALLNPRQYGIGVSTFRHDEDSSFASAEDFGQLITQGTEVFQSAGEKARAMGIMDADMMSEDGSEPFASTPVHFLLR